ncbi:MAG TPA: hypothetical protein VGD63_16480 [Steroidobacteraceae bacterium]
MDITKIPAPESGSSGVASGVASGATTPGVVTPSEQGAKAPPNLVATADEVDIRPLDLSAALQILIAEVRASFESQALLAAAGIETPGVAIPGAAPDNPQQAARALMEIILQAQPEEAGNAQWGAALAHMEIMLQSGLERGISVVTLWRNVPAPVIETTNETRALILALLDEGPENPIWLRPEWAGLAPRFERFWRRRRRARRRLSDPDYASEGFDSDEHRS